MKSIGLYKTWTRIYHEDHKRDRLLLLSCISIPIVWGVLQFYHLIFSRPIIEWVIATFPQLSKNFKTPYPFVAAMLNLVIFGTLAMIWPDRGFGHSWRPSRQQSLVVLLLISFSLIYPSLNTLDNGNPFKEMGFVIWTITPVEEEILFRGFLYALLLRIFNRSPDSTFREVLPVLVLGAVWFSLWHLSPLAVAKYGWNMMGLQLISTFVAGIVFNGLRHWTGSIWLVIPVHAAGNFMVSLM
jgi:membrane protease YdiL (CAAX protease family)